MIRHLITRFALAAILLPCPSTAQEGRSITLEEALRLSAENSLELRIARSRVDQAGGLARQAGAFPNPTLNATHEPLHGASTSYSETYLTASQRLELSGARGARSDAAARRADATVFQYRADSLRVAFELKRAYAEAVLSQEREAVSRRVAGVFREAARSARARYDAGDISRFTLRRIDIERARYETLLAEAQIEVGSAQRRLALLVAPADDASRLAAAGLPAVTPPTAPVEGQARDAAEARPELAAVRADAQAEAAEARLVRAERVPDVTATGGFKRQTGGLRGAFVGLSLPVPLFDRGTGAVQAADARLRAADERIELTRRQLENEAMRATEAYRALAARWALLAGAGTEPADDLLDIALVAYDEGDMELIELLDAAEAAHTASIARARLTAELWVAYFDLDRAVAGFPASPAGGGSP